MNKIIQKIIIIIRRKGGTNKEGKKEVQIKKKKEVQIKKKKEVQLKKKK